MKTLIIVVHFPLETENIKGGVHSAIKNLIQGFEKTSVNVRLLSFNFEITQPKKIQLNERIEICYEPEGRLPFHSLNYLIYGPGLVKKHIRDFQPDIIHYQNGNSLLFSAMGGLSGIPYVLTAHAFAWEEMKTKKSYKDKITWWYNGWIHRLFSPKNVIYISNQSQQKNASDQIQHDTIIANAISDVFFHIPEKKKYDNRLLYIGIINHRKNLLLLLQTMSRLNEKGVQYSLDVVGDFGDDDYRTLIMNYINQQNLQQQVQLLGWKSQKEIIQLLQNSDLLVLPSLQETLPMVIAEAMAAGKTVIASNVGGIPEMIEHEKTGFIFNIHQPNELDEMLIKLYNNQELAQIVGKRAKEKTFQLQSAQSVAEKTELFYHTIIQTGQPQK